MLAGTDASGECPDPEDLFDLLTESLQGHQVQDGCLEVHRLLCDGAATPGALPEGVAAHALACDLCLLRLARDLTGLPEPGLPDLLAELADDLSPLLTWRVQALQRQTRAAGGGRPRHAGAAGDTGELQAVGRELIEGIARRKPGAEQACFSHLRGRHSLLSEDGPGRSAMGSAHLELVMLIRSGTLQWTSAADLYRVFERILQRHLQRAREVADPDILAEVLSLASYRELIQNRRMVERTVNQRLRQIEAFCPSAGGGDVERAAVQPAGATGPRLRPLVAETTGDGRTLIVLRGQGALRVRGALLSREGIPLGYGAFLPIVLGDFTARACLVVGGKGEPRRLDPRAVLEGMTVEIVDDPLG